MSCRWRAATRSPLRGCSRRRGAAGHGQHALQRMPGGTINPTIDGVNNSSNGFKSGGTSFFGTVPARLGAGSMHMVETAGFMAMME